MHRKDKEVQKWGKAIRESTELLSSENSSRSGLGQGEGRSSPGHSAQSWVTTPWGSHPLNHWNIWGLAQRNDHEVIEEISLFRQRVKIRISAMRGQTRKIWSSEIWSQFCLVGSETAVVPCSPSIGFGQHSFTHTVQRTRWINILNSKHVIQKAGACIRAGSYSVWGNTILKGCKNNSDLHHLCSELSQERPTLTQFQPRSFLLPA